MKQKKIMSKPLMPQGWLSVGGILRSAPDLKEETPEELLFGWFRGNAVIVDGDVVLEEEERENYQPENEPILFEFVNLSLNPTIDPDPERIRQFVSRYGLLYDEYVNHWREPLEGWNFVYRHLREQVTLYQAINAAKRQEVEGIRSLAHIVDQKYRASALRADDSSPLMLSDLSITALFEELYENQAFGQEQNVSFSASQQSELIRVGSVLLAHRIKKHLEGVQLRISNEELIHKTLGKAKANRSETYAMALDLNAFDLLSYLYLQLALMSVDNSPLNLCLCGRLFAPTRADQKFCSKTCGSNKRGAAKRAKDNCKDGSPFID